jgi:hypothetical protein
MEKRGDKIVKFGSDTKFIDFGYVAIKIIAIGGFLYSKFEEFFQVYL